MRAVDNIHGARPERHRREQASFASRSLLVESALLQACVDYDQYRDASVGLWRKHKERLAGQLQLHGPISDTLQEMNYESDDMWLQELTGKTPDLTPSHWADIVDEQQETCLKSLDRLLDEYLKKRGLN